MTPLERSAVYAGFAAALRSADGGTELLETSVVPEPPADAGQAGSAFLAAFDPSVSKTAVSLHGAAHLSREQTDLYQELIRWYSHFGLKRRDGGELPDHLAVMLEFLQFLAFQEHSNMDDAASVESLRRSQAAFISRLAAPVARSVARQTESDVPRYAALPGALEAFLDDELAELQAAS